MSIERNIAVVRRLFEEGFTEGREDVCDDLVAEDAIEHQRGLRPGREGVKDTIRTLHAWFSDFTLVIEDLAAVDDKVWIRACGRGRNTGSVLGRPATGRRTEITVFDVVRLEDGRIVEHWGVPDQLGLMVQLGHVNLRPDPEPAPVA